ncbi:TolC family protein, partial [Acidobacteriota bacterium]
MKVHLLIILLVAGIAGLSASLPARGDQEEVSASSFSLDKAVRWAWDHNHDVQTMQQKLTELKGRVREEKSAMFPTINFDYNYSRFRDPGILNSSSFKDITEEFPFALTPEAQNLFDMSVSIDQTLYAWGKIATGLKIVKLAVDSGELDIDVTKASVGLEVARGYYDVLLATVARRALKKSEEHAIRNLEVTRNRFDVGEATKVDLLRAKAQLATLAPQLLEAEQMIRESKAVLNRILGRPINAPLEIERPLEGQDEAIPSLQTVLEKARLRRSELKKIKLEKEMLVKANKLTKTDLKPSLEANGAFGLSTAFYEEAFKFNPDYLSWRLGIHFNFPLWDGGRVKGRVQQVESQMTQNEIGLSDLLNSIDL